MKAVDFRVFFSCATVPSFEKMHPNQNRDMLGRQFFPFENYTILSWPDNFTDCKIFEVVIVYGLK